MSIKGVFPIDKWDFKRESVLEHLPVGDLEILTVNKSEQVCKKGETFSEKELIRQAYFILLMEK